MKWFEGSIAEAVNLSKQRDAVFVVYVEGTDDLSVKLRGFIGEDKIQSKLQSDNFVAIKIDSGSEAYMQFAQIYQLVPLPSIFFIGKNGAPIQVVTGVISTSDDLENKINAVLETVGIKESTTPSLQGETSSTSIASSSNAAASSQNLISSEQSNPDVICEGGVCYRRPKTTDETTAKPSPPSSDVDSNISPSSPLVEAGSVEEAHTQSPIASPESAETAPTQSNADLAAKIEDARKLIEAKRKEKEEEEKRLQLEREIRRRKEGQGAQHLQKWQKEQDFQQLKENIRRERQEEQAARQRILEKIASDRAEHAQKFSPSSVPSNEKPAPEPSTSQNAQSPKPNSLEFSRIQFRKPEGETTTHTFKSSEQFQTVRDYVRASILSDSGIRDFSLATTFPRREFTTTDDSKSLLELGLCPSAVLLVIAGQRSAHSPSAIVARSGGIVNVFNTIFWGLLTPVFAVFGYIRRFFSGGRPDTTSTAATGAQKRANEENMADNDAAKRRNIDRLINPKFVNDEPSSSNSDKSKKETPYRRVGSGSNIHRLRENKESDDENNTWNGNSTQQQ